MDAKRAIATISFTLFIIGLLLLAYGAYYNSRLGLSLQPQSVPANSINATINKTEALLNIANRSSYLVFYPNLNKPYSYLTKAKSIAKEDPGLAYTLLGLAYNDTQQQINYLNSYKTDSFYVMLVLTIISAYVLYRIINYKDADAGSNPGQNNAKPIEKRTTRRKSTK
jgi:hypothetical protein